MTAFSNDADILKYEPAVFGELYPTGQVLASGTGGTLSGTQFTASGADFAAAQVSAGGVIYLRSSDLVVDGAYEIVSVDSATELTVSIIRPDGDCNSIVPAGGTDLFYRISTFGPQAGEMGFQLAEYFGFSTSSGEGEISAANITDTEALRRVSVFGVIAAAYAMLASKAENENFWTKSLYYQRLFTRARERCKVSIDTSGDGIGDVTRLGGSGRLIRD